MCSYRGIRLVSARTVVTEKKMTENVGKDAV